LLCAGIAGTVCFAALIAIHLITGWQEEAYFASLPAFFVPLDAATDPAVLAEPPLAPIDFEALRNKFPNAVAWIRIDGTSVNYPVMRGPDNEYYLTRRPDGRTSRSGSIFMDFRNSPDFSDPNTLIHGHRMRSGAMFGMLSNYSSQSFYDRHLTVSIFTPQGDFEILLFAGYAIDQVVEVVPMNFRDTEDFDRFIQRARRRSMFRSDVEVSFGDRLVTLATCEYTFSDGRGRLVIVGKLVENGY